MRIITLLLLSSLPLLAAEPPRWFKGNTHTHSLWSDGNDFPEMIAAWYKEQGYHFLAMSDHNVLAEGDRWMPERAIEQRKITIGRKVLEKYKERFGAEWVQTRPTADESLEVRLKTLAEYRQKLEVPDQFLLFQAEEISAAFGKVPIHINALNLTEVIRPLKDVTSIRETIRVNLQAAAAQAVKAGRPILAHINHPNFRWALTAEDLAHVIEMRYFEVFNGHPLTFAEGDAARAESATDRMWDVANTIRLAELRQPPLYGIGSDDSHHYHGGTATSGRAWVMVRAPALDPDAIVEAMNRGDFYSSTGVSLDDVTFDGHKLGLKIHAKPSVHYVTEFRGTLRGYDRAVRQVPSPPDDPQPVRLRYSPDVGKVLARSEELEPSYQLTGNEWYVRAVIVSDEVMANPINPGQKQQAWTQPVGWRGANP